MRKELIFKIPCVYHEYSICKGYGHYKPPLQNKNTDHKTAIKHSIIINLSNLPSFFEVEN